MKPLVDLTLYGTRTEETATGISATVPAMVDARINVAMDEWFHHLQSMSANPFLQSQPFGESLPPAARIPVNTILLLQPSGQQDTHVPPHQPTIQPLSSLHSLARAAAQSCPATNLHPGHRLTVV